MKQIIIILVVGSLCLFGLTALAQEEEPILVIDPQGHSALIEAVMFTPDGSTLISVANDKTIRLWDVESGDLRRTFRIQIGEGIRGRIDAGAISPDGRLLAVAGWPYNYDEYGVPIHLFDLASGEIIALLKGHTDVIWNVEFSQDGKWLVSGGDKTVRIWDVSGQDVPTGAVAILEGHTDGVTNIGVAPDMSQIVSASFDSTLRFWELSEDRRSAKTSKTLKKHPVYVECVAYSPDGKYIVSGDGESNIFLWNSKGKFVKRIAEQYPGVIAFSADSKKVVVGGTQDQPVTVYAIPSGKKLATFDKHTNFVAAAAFYGNDLIASAGGNAKDMYIWDAGSGEVKTHIVGKGEAVWSVAFDQGLTVAFGNTNTAFGEIHVGAKEFPQFAAYPEHVPLERSFDFAEMSLNQRTPAEKEFTRSLTKHEGQALKRVTWRELKVKGAGTITHTGDGARWIHAYTFTRNGDVVAGFEPWIRLYQSDGAQIREFTGHTGEIWALAVSKDGRLFASASDDQTIKLWNIETGECLATLFVTRDNEWICWTPQGYYAASAGGEKYIGWHLNQGMEHAAKFHPVSVFRKRFHQPELVKQTIALGGFEQALTLVNAEARRPIEQTAVTEVLPPEVRWVSPDTLSIEATEPSIQIKAEISSESEITEIKILVNGRVQEASRGLALEEVQTTDTGTLIVRDVTLAPGNNEIAIFAANREAGGTSEVRTVVYDSSAQDWLKPKVYMISVGISKYAQAGMDLEYADDDAKAMSELFRSQEGTLYQSVTIKELYDEEATRDNILDALEWLEDETTQKDIAVIFMAAHGINDDRGNFYMLPADGDPENLRRTGVDWGDFVDILGNLPSRVLFFLDTCHSGQLGQNLFRMRGEVDNTEAIRELASDENGVVILAASTGKEYSLEHPEWGHGAFTRALLDGLQDGNADYTGDGIVHLRELDTYIAERVKELTEGSQHPTTLKPSSISRFPIVQVQ